MQQQQKVLLFLFFLLSSANIISFFPQKKVIISQHIFFLLSEKKLEGRKKALIINHDALSLSSSRTKKICSIYNQHILHNKEIMLIMEEQRERERILFLGCNILIIFNMIL